MSENIKIFQNFVLFATPNAGEGFARLIDFGGALDQYNISPSEALADKRAIESDWKTVGDDLREAVFEYEHESDLK